MKVGTDEAAEFRAECVKWQSKLGLMHWTVKYIIKEAQGQNDEADVDYDCETRHATITYYTGVEDAIHPKDTALHEMLHLLLADTLLAGVMARRGDESDVPMAREEHKVIEVLIKVIK